VQDDNYGSVNTSVSPLIIFPPFQRPMKFADPAGVHEQCLKSCQWQLTAGSVTHVGQVLNGQQRDLGPTCGNGSGADFLIL